MNLTPEIVFVRMVSTYRGYIMWQEVADEDGWHSATHGELRYMQGKIDAYLECAYLPEDREDKRTLAFLQAFRMHKTGDTE